jgi:hypothetical protein
MDEIRKMTGLRVQHSPSTSHAGGLKLKSVSSSPGHAMVDAEWYVSDISPALWRISIGNSDDE